MKGDAGDELPYKPQYDVLDVYANALLPGDLYGRGVR